MGFVNVGIIVCTRMKSKRLPNKCAIEVNGKPVLEHLHNRLLQTGFPIVYACPTSELDQYNLLFKGFGGKFCVFDGHQYDPLARMRAACMFYKFDYVVRVTHDKIFVDPDVIKQVAEHTVGMEVDYAYPYSPVNGTSFEVISSECLEKSYARFKDVEHISYAAKSVAKETYCAITDLQVEQKENLRLLIDYPEDINLVNAILACLGNDCTTQQVVEFLRKNKWAKEINRIPELTIYTCAYNAEKWLTRTINSVMALTDFRLYEYLLIDDGSTDGTPGIMSHAASLFPNIRYIRLPKNVGLASASNIALENAKAKLICRMDADDIFVDSDVIGKMLSSITENIDVLYPDNYLGSWDNVQKGDKHHHIGGAVFKTSALNHLKFTDGLRHYDGFDLYKRAKEVLKIGYYNHPTFVYRQHPGSLSSVETPERAATKKRIEAFSEKHQLRS